MDLYAENILEHYKNPRHFGPLEGANAVFEDVNPLCGDKIGFEFLVKDGIVTRVGFTGSGCAISLAAASLLSDELSGKKIGEVLDMEKQQVYDLLGVPISSGRVKCALLGYTVMRKALEIYLQRKHEPQE